MEENTSLRYQLISAWCGPAFLITFVFFWGILGHNLPNPSPALSASDLAARYINNLGEIRVGFIVSMILVCLYMPWTCVLAAQMARIEGKFPVLAYLQLIAAALVGLSDKSKVPLFPRWVCFLTIWCSISFFPASLTGVLKTGPFAWNGALSYYIPYFCWLCWYTTASIYMIKEVRRRMVGADAAAASGRLAAA